MRKPKRSDAMDAVLETLSQLQPPGSAAWLGRSLKPPVSRQTVSDWFDVPEHYIQQVAKLIAVAPEVVRPDLAAIFAPKERPSRKRAA